MSKVGSLGVGRTELGRFVGKVCGCEVYAVNGDLVRDAFSTDFALGGHNRKWKWIPGGMVWVEVTSSTRGKMLHEDFGKNVLHELVEYALMRYDRLTYSKAHDKALRYEMVFRAVGYKRKPKSREEALVTVRGFMDAYFPGLDLGSS